MLVPEEADGEPVDPSIETSPSPNDATPIVSSSDAQPTAGTQEEPAIPKPGSIQPSDFYNVGDFFHYFGYEQIPLQPTADRDLAVLLDVDDVWSLSRPERHRLDAFWTSEVRLAQQEDRVREFERLRQKHAAALERYNEGKAAVRLNGRF